MRCSPGRRVCSASPTSVPLPLPLPGGAGCVITKTGQCVIIAVFESPISPSDCVCEVEKLADYLISMQM